MPPLTTATKQLVQGTRKADNGRYEYLIGDRWVSRQRVWSLIRQQSGKCKQCGKPLNRSGLMCKRCAKKHAELLARR